jgi:methionyl-tRNA formyltransferase
MLPSYRGASPISSAILEGRHETGVTLMRMDTGLDTGPMLAQRSIQIEPDATTASLTPKLAQVGAKLLTDTLGSLIDGSIVAVAQDDQQASLTRPLVKADGWIDWNQSAAEIERQVRAMWDWPRAWTTLLGEPIQIHRAIVEPSQSNSAPGKIESIDGYPAVATGDGQLLLEIAQSAGGKPLPGSVWLQQSRAIDKILGDSGAPLSPTLPMIRRSSS